MCETVCDKDGFVANVWRGIKFDPDEVAKWCDWPVNHADLNARRKALIKNEERLLENLCADPEWFDAKLAGYWVWAASCWIGSGLTRPGAMPHVSNRCQGVHAGQIPRVSVAGQGLNSIDSRGKIYEWMQELSVRLRNVRVVCGDWSRVCGGNWQNGMGVCGMFFDPPYGVTDRDASGYHHDSVTVACDVMEWVRERGARDGYRIVLAGYEEYHELVDNHGWTCKQWKAQGGYSNQGKGAGENNRHRETLYFSPQCVSHDKQDDLFSDILFDRGKI